MSYQLGDWGDLFIYLFSDQVLQLDLLLALFYYYLLGKILNWSFLWMSSYVNLYTFPNVYDGCIQICEDGIVDILNTQVISFCENTERYPTYL